MERLENGEKMETEKQRGGEREQLVDVEEERRKDDCGTRGRKRRVFIKEPCGIYSMQCASDRWMVERGQNK